MSSRNNRATDFAHFVSFAAILEPGDNVSQDMAIRLPLRLPGSGSKIKSTPPCIETASQIFRDFIVTELPESILSLRPVTNIDLKKIDDKGNGIFLAAEMENADAIAVQRSRNRGREEESSLHRLTTIVQGGSGPMSAKHWLINHFVERYQTASSNGR